MADIATPLPAAADRGSTSSVEKAFAVLEVLVRADADLSLGDVASRSALSKPTAHRLLQTLVRNGFVRQTHERHYAVGFRMYRLAGATMARADHSEAIRPALSRLHEATPETVHLARFAGDEAVYVEKLEGRRPYRMASTIGMRLELHCTAIGKAVLAFLPEEHRQRLLESLELRRRTPHTHTSLRTLKEDLDAIAQRGYALDEEENEEGIRCVAAPVFDARGQVFGAVSVSAPTFHLSRADAIELARAVITATRDASLALGAPLDGLPRPFSVPAD